MLERLVLVHYSLIICFFTSHDVFSSSGIVVSSHDAIQRRPLSHYHSLYEDPDDWTPLISVTRATPVYPRGGGLFFRDEQPHDIISLRPRGIASIAPLTHLLGKEIIDGEASRWTSASFIAPLECHGYQLEWTRYILMREEAVLERTGIYDLIFCRCFVTTLTHPGCGPFARGGTIPLTLCSLMTGS
jgi:hypothetical protein